ncbi:MAG TPA: hypothetical protein VMW75_14685 [Thermoanaerobaculia bacterium]|nr:hypothetical protein [Thermoanaerobaculia bacterium]
MLRSITSFSLCALLVWGSVPSAAGASAQGAGCRMACCLRGTSSPTAMTAMKPMQAMAEAGGGAAAPGAATPLCCSCGSGQVPRHAGLLGGNPSVLPDPPRLPTPLGVSLLDRHPGPARELPCLDLPVRPPRA